MNKPSAEIGHTPDLHMRIHGVEGYSALTDPGVVEGLLAEGVDPLTIELLPDSIANSLEKAAKQTDIVAPPYRSNHTI